MEFAKSTTECYYARKVPIMHIDKLDLKILRFLLEKREKNENITTTAIAKQIFEINDREEYQKKDAFIRKRLNKLKDFGLINKAQEKINGREISFYSVNSESFIMGDVAMRIKPDFEDTVREMNVENMIFIRNNPGWIIYGYN